MKYAWVNFTTSNVTSKLIGMRLLKRMMKVKKFSPKLLAPPSIGGGWNRKPVQLPAPWPGTSFPSLFYYYYRYYFLVLIILGHGPFLSIPVKLTCHWTRVFRDYWFRYMFWGEDSGSTSSSHCWEYKTWVNTPPPAQLSKWWGLDAIGTSRARHCCTEHQRAPFPLGWNSSVQG